MNGNLGKFLTVLAVFIVLMIIIGANAPQVTQNFWDLVTSVINWFRTLG